MESLAVPNRRLREGIFDLLEHLDIKDGDVYHFARKGLERCYGCLAMAVNASSLDPTPIRKLVSTHLMEKKNIILESVLRVLAIHDDTGRMKTAWQGVLSSNTKYQSNAVELISSLLDRRLFETLRPLVESPTPEVAVMEGRAFVTLPRLDDTGVDLYKQLVASDGLGGCRAGAGSECGRPGTHAER